MNPRSLLSMIALVLVPGCTRDLPRPEGPRLIGSRGAGAGQFDRPRTITCLPDGTIWVADMTGRIQALDYQGRHLRTIHLPETARGRPTGLSYDAKGNLLVAETHYHRVSRYSPEGKLLQSWGEFGKGEGQFVLLTGIATDREGNVFVSEQGEENDRVQKFTSRGEFLLAFGSFGEAPGQFRRPTAIACDGEGLVYVADAVNHRVQKFDGQGTLLDVWGGIGTESGQFRYPWGITVGRDGVIYVCEYQNGRIQAFSKDGEVLGIYGRPGPRVGEFYSPKGITPGRNGDLIVADTDNHRLQVMASFRDWGEN